MANMAIRLRGPIRWLMVALALPLVLIRVPDANAKDAAPSQQVQQLLAGTWALTEDSTYRAWAACCDGPGTEVPFTPKYRKIRDDFANIPADIKPTPNNLAHCISPGVPGTFEHPILFEFLLTPGRVNLIFADGSFRRIWTDGRPFPATLTPGLQGYSIGHWKGNTLTVETRGLSVKTDMFIEGPVKVTNQTKVTEQMIVESSKSLRIKTTVEDPAIFTKPYSYENLFTKVPISFEVSCTLDNRDSGNKVDLTPPSDEE
jgi:hypothetical protein